jgi:cobyrinic acid a,c-diamide synthase
VISDIGPILEVDHSLMHETSLPRRHATSLTALESARVTVICARADAVGLARLVRGYLEFHELFSKSDVHVMLWGVTSESNAQDVSNAVTRHTGIESVTTVPLDWNASRKALQGASFVGKQNPKNEIAKQFEKLAKTIAEQHQISDQVTSITKPRKKLLKRAA